MGQTAGIGEVVGLAQILHLIFELHRWLFTHGPLPAHRVHLGSLGVCLRSETLTDLGQVFGLAVIQVICTIGESLG